MLELDLLPSHFKDGRLILRCEAQITSIYNEDAVLELESARRPKDVKGKSQLDTILLNDYVIFITKFCFIDNAANTAYSLSFLLYFFMYILGVLTDHVVHYLRYFTNIRL